MSSSGFSRNLVVDRPGCRRVQVLIACLMLLSLAALGYGGLPGWPGVLVALLATAGGWRELRRASPHAARFVERIVVTGDGRFLLVLAGDPATLVPSVVVHSWTVPGVAVGLAFDTEGNRRVPPIILFRDRVPADTWRRMAVRLRH